MTDRPFYGWPFPAAGVTSVGGNPIAKRTQADRESDIVNVLDWGAIGDRSTDDYPAVAAAIAYAMSTKANGSKGGTVFFPPGQYSLTSAPGGILTIGSSDPNVSVNLISTACFTTTIRHTDASGLTISKGAQLYDNLERLEGLELDGGITLTGNNQIVASCVIYGCIDASAATSALIRDNSGSAGYSFTAENAVGGNPPSVRSTYVWCYLGDNCVAQNNRTVGGNDISYALSGNCPSMIGNSTETCRTGVRVGWAPTGEKTAYGFLVQAFQTERTDVSVDLYNCDGGMVSGCISQAQVGSPGEPNPAVANITWAATAGGTATVTTVVNHNIPAGTDIIQLTGGGITAPFIDAALTFPWVVATSTVPASRSFTYFLPSNPGAFPSIGTSTTSVAVGSGSKSFTTQTGLSLTGTIEVYSRAAPNTNYMIGSVTSYNSASGALVVNVTTVAGSGTFTDWTINNIGSWGWNYPQFYSLRCRIVKNTAILANSFAGQMAYASIDLNYDGQASGHKNNVFWGAEPAYGVIPPSANNLAGWTFVGMAAPAPHQLEGRGGWTKGTVANPDGRMVFANLPGQGSVVQPRMEGQQYIITDGDAAGFGATQAGGSPGNKYLVRWNGTSWTRCG